MTEELVRLVASFQGDPWAPLAFVLVYSLACLALPITLFAVAGGVLFGFWGGLACNMAGCLLGSSAAFWIARRWGKARVQRWIAGRWPAFAAGAAGQNFRGMLAARLIGLPPFGVMNYLAGVTKIEWGSYVGATFVGSLPWLATVTYCSGVLWEVWLVSGAKGFRAALAEFTGPLLAAALAFVGFTWLARSAAAASGLKRWLKRRSNRS